MFSIAILIGIYSYLIFTLGLLGLLYKVNIVILAFGFLVIITWLRSKEIIKAIGEIWEIREIIIKKNLIVLLLILFILQAFVNFIGTLGPELAFDALWYHLTLPKLYLLNHAVVHIPGRLLYYSDMPKLTEMLYTGALAFQGEVLAKLIHFSFGILISVALYKLSRKFFSPTFAMISVVIFYSNLVVGWQSIAAYIDLARTFFEVMALWAFVNWWERKEQKYLIESSVMLGLAISTKLLAIGSLVIFTLLIVYKYLSERKKITSSLITNMLVYWCSSLLIVSPWLAFSFIHTGNPIYPLFTDVYKIYFNLNLLSPRHFLNDMWIMFTQLADPISPIYIIFLPLILVYFRKFNMKIKLVVFYSLLSIVVWYITPRTGGGRFIMPYLPAFSIVVAGTIGVIKEVRVKKILIGLIIVVSLFSIIYRGVANTKYLPVILGKQTKSEFLSKNLNFSFGDFYDTDDYFKRNIAPNNTVLLYGFHNLYYIDFPFIDSSWVKKGNTFNYIAVQNGEIPYRFRYWQLVYENRKTNVKLYSSGGKTWVY